MHISHQTCPVVHQDHSDATCCSNCQALVDTRVNATVANHDLAQHQGWIEQPGVKAKGQVRCIGTRDTCVLGPDHGRSRQCSCIDRRTGIRCTVAQRHIALERPGVGRGSHRGQPWAHVGNSDTGSAISGRRCDEHARIGRAQESLFDWVIDAGLAAAD